VRGFGDVVREAGHAGADMRLVNSSNQLPVNLCSCEETPTHNRTITLTAFDASLVAWRAAAPVTANLLSQRGTGSTPSSAANTSQKWLMVGGWVGGWVGGLIGWLVGRSVGRSILWR